MAFSLDPGVIALVALGTALYLRAVRTLRARGYRVPAAQQVAWHAGMALTAVALLSPLDPLSERLLSAHMAQHLLIADLGGPLMLVGLRTPVLVFFLPRPVLVPLARWHGLRRVLRTLARPLVAIPVYVLVLYAWHLGVLFEGALRHPAVHALQHASFVAISVLVWWSAVEPQRRRVPGELWKAGHILGARMAGMMLGMGFVFTRTAIYGGFYGHGPRAFGLSPLLDQQIGGALMFGLDLVIMLGGFTFFFWRAAQDHDRAQALAEEPVSPPVVAA